MMGGARGGEAGEGPRDETQDMFCSGRGQEVRGERREARSEKREERQEGGRRVGARLIEAWWLCSGSEAKGASWDLAGDGKREREGVRAGLGWVDSVGSVGSVGSVVSLNNGRHAAG
jgi:hypothetical protein